MARAIEGDGFLRQPLEPSASATSILATVARAHIAAIEFAGRGGHSACAPRSTTALIAENHRPPHARWMQDVHMAGALAVRNKTGAAPATANVPSLRQDGLRAARAESELEFRYPACISTTR